MRKRELCKLIKNHLNYCTNALHPTVLFKLFKNPKTQSRSFLHTLGPYTAVLKKKKKLVVNYFSMFSKFVLPHNIYSTNEQFKLKLSDKIFCFKHPDRKSNSSFLTTNQNRDPDAELQYYREHEKLSVVT